MMRRIGQLGAVSALALAAGPLEAQDIHDCDWRASAAAIAEPWDSHTRSFANGAVRLALLDTIEPAAGSHYLLILSPPYDEIGGRMCKVVGFGDGLGYLMLDFADLQAAYDPARGLSFSLQGRLYDPASDFGNALVLHVTVNQATGAVEAWHELGGE
ncbi:MAG: hypothetical protein HLUCCA08_14580 [Rhodobacteraceae bacterium HLUCCA08]|nr:MAG: hypothetical protein HLUCCA08_14580 [Rhodobacteraceae bacterium HLUCCA08]